MQLRGKKWQMQKPRHRRRSNPVFIFFLLLLIAAVAYFNQFVVPTLPATSVATPTATQNPESIVTQAEEQFAAGNLQPAIELYKQAILSGGASSALFAELARIQMHAGEYEAALTSAQDALLMNPENPTALVMYSWAISFLGNEIEAEETIRRAIELNPDNPLAHAVYAEILADQAFPDYELAAEESRTAMALDPDILEVRRARGYILEVTGNYNEALEQYEAALAINDNISDLHLALGRVYRAMGLNEEAIDEFSLANALNPTNPLPDTYMARIYLMLGEYGKAIQTFEQAVEEDPTNPIRYGNLGTAFYRNFQYDEAIDAFSYAIQGGVTDAGEVVNGLALDRDVAEYFYLFGLALARSFRCGEALPIFQALLAIVPENQIAVDNAQEGLRICQDVADNPPTATPQPTEEEG